MRIQRNILFNPGPATTTDSVKHALVVPDICPREKEFAQLADSIRLDLVKVVQGGKDYVCVLLAGSGTAAMDACINSVVPAQGKIAIINNGAYGKRLIDIARAYGLIYVEIASSSHEQIDLHRIENVLKADPTISCLAMVHHETTTGLLNPLNDIGDIAKKYNCVFIVDAISSYAGIPIDIRKANVDFLMSTSNKCIQGMPGAAFVICREQKLEALKNNPRRSFYLCLYDEYAYFKKTGETRFTPPVQVLYALRQAIDEFFKEGIKGRYQRYTENWKTLRSGLEDLGFELLLKKEDESHILLTVVEPYHPKYDFNTMHDLLYKKGFTIYPGKIEQKTFRLANMGAIDSRDVKKFLKELKSVLKKMGVVLKTPAKH